MRSSGRSFCTATLEVDDIKALVDQKSQLTEVEMRKIEEFKQRISLVGYDQASYIAARDMNEDETGSYFVENGAHRTRAVKELLKETPDKFSKIKIPAVIAFRI